MTASIPAGDIATAGSASVTVRNPDLQVSNSQAFVINTAGSGCSTGQYLAQYFSNTTLTGTAVRTACETAINYNFGLGGPPGVPVDNFSVRWTGRFSFGAGSVTFTARGDDGIRLFLDGVQIIDGWRDQPATTYTATRTVTAGEHEVKVEYYDRQWDAVAQVSWVAGVPAPTLTTLTPGTATAGGAGFTLTADGTNFVSGATVLWNGAPRTTTFVSGTRMTASIPAGDIATAGSATVTVRNPDSTISNGRTFTITTAKSGRFSGPYESPFICMTVQAGLGSPLDADCSAPTIVAYVYRSTSGTFKPLADPTLRPSDLSQTVVDGQNVPFIVRIEKGTINRSIYEIARLNDPAGWNGRLIYIFGGGCEGGWYIQGSETAGVLDDAMLGRGYATASASLNVFGTNCNDVLAAETMMMVKDRFVTEFGAPAFTIGWGCSGGAYQAHLIGDNYPGLLDGIIVGCSFPDVTSVTILTVTDASLLQRYFGSATGWTTEQRRAVSGFSQAAAIGTLAPAASRIDPDAGCNASIPPEWRYNAATNPAGARCDVYDHTVNVYGRDPQTGFARRPLDNVGVQYGLGALNAGVISKQQFLDLNAKIGGFDNDGNFITSRTVADSLAVQAAHETGRVLYGGAGMAGIPIIDYRAYNDLVTGGDLHMKIHSFATRERLRATTGQSANHVMLVEDQRYGDFSLASPVLSEALWAMDNWLVALLSDHSNDVPTVKVSRAKPATLVDACYDSAGQRIPEPATIQGGACNGLYPTFSTPRLVAGAPIADNVLKCSLKPVASGDYAVTFTASEMAQLRQIFPSGVCDYSIVGPWQRPLQGTWLSY
jgi:hypothetical protein